MSKQSTERTSNPPKVTQVGSWNSLEVVLLTSALYDPTHGAPGPLFELRLGQVGHDEPLRTTQSIGGRKVAII